MPKIILTREQFTRLEKFCTENFCKWFVAKDEGAYVGASCGTVDGKVKNCIFYFSSCDPTKDENYYDTSRQLFGGDDFGEMLPVGTLTDAVSDLSVDRIDISVNDESITITKF